MKKSVVLLSAVLLFIGCSVSRQMASRNLSAEISQIPKEEHNSPADTLPTLAMKIEHRGDSLYLVETEKSDSGNIMSLKAMTVHVRGNVRNLPERNGRVHMEFKVIFPKSMLGTQRHILLCPVLYRNPSDSLCFEPLLLRGEAMDILQERELWQYMTFLRRFYRDTSSIRMAYDKFVRFPLLTGTKMDSVVTGKNDVTYYYHKDIQSTETTKKMTLIVPGEARSIDGSLYLIPPKDTLRFIVSSMTYFIDTVRKYKTEIVDRYLSLSRNYKVMFRLGSHRLERDYLNNRAEINDMNSLKNEILQSEEFQTDSITITAASSPEGNFNLNLKLSQHRAAEVRDSLFPSVKVSISSEAENWNELQKAIESSDFLKREDLLHIIQNEKDPDQREMLIRKNYPVYYRQLKDSIYPKLRHVNVTYHLKRKGMTKDTIHLNVLDTLYNRAVDMLQNKRYSKALEILRPYSDRNTAIAFLSLGYDREAMKIISKEEESDSKEYIMAILCARLNMFKEGREHYLRACRLNSRMEFRGNLDPEINRLLTTK